MALSPAEFAARLLREAQETHPWLHHPLFRMIYPIRMQRMAQALETHYGVPRPALDFYYVHMEVEGDHSDRAVRILERLALTDEDQARGRSAMRRAITARRICADGLLGAFVTRRP